MTVVRLLTSAIDETPWPGPDYSPTVFDGGYPHGNQIKPHDLYHSVMGPWYEYVLIEWAPFTGKKKGYDWVRIPGRPEEADW